MKKSLLPLLILLLTLVSCSKEEDRTVEKQSNSAQSQIDQSKVVGGVIRIKMTDAFISQLQIKEGTKSVSTKVQEMNSAIEDIGATNIRRTFPYAGRFEARTRAEGLHLWYNVSFDSTVTVQKAYDCLRKIKGIIMAEPIRKPKIVGNPVVYTELGPIYTKSTEVSKRTALPFNDPYLSKQWHYSNDGTIGTAGCDINLFDAWSKYTAGSSDVIVAVVDGGIDTDHEDLQSAMWTNLLELNGKQGVDDDNNGYVDDIYGYDFVYNSAKIVDDKHGTHVAGTVGAVNNNGIGGCGVAGGNGTVPGVKLMSCQIFVGNVTGDAAAALKYAADNGAVIAQNSWGYDTGATSIEEADKAAIDYFIKYAGIDENGKQVGPMKGGIVIFAAGNDNSELGWPANYDKVLSVAAVGADFKRAYYSNYGDWVDIAAPGGNYRSFSTEGEILSTFPDNQYGFIQGTSMACPHVSGIAALIVSKYKNFGITPDEVWKRIVNSATPIDQYNAGFEGKIGKGLVNASSSLKPLSYIAPERITDLSCAANSNSVTVTFSVPEDKDDGKPSRYYIYYATRDISDMSISQVPSDVKNLLINAGEENVGEKMTCKIVVDSFNTKYYFVIFACDNSGNVSAISNQAQCSIGINNPPLIISQDGDNLIVKYFESKSLKFNISDPDGHDMIWNVSGSTSALSYTPSTNSITGGSGTLQISVKGSAASAGSYIATLTVADIYGAYTSKIISYTILSNNPPKAVKTPPDMILGGVGKTISLSGEDYITDIDEEPLSYSFSYSEENIVSCEASSDGTLTITGKGYGTTQITITAKDAKGETASVTFKVLVRDSNKEVDLYPNPVKKILYIRTANTETISVKLYSSSGAKVFQGTFSISPFAPASVDMTKMAAGTYTLLMTTDGKEIKRSIVKM